MRVGEHDEVGRVLLEDARERIHVRLIGNVQAMPIDRRIERERFEEVSARAREQRQSVGGARNVAHVGLDLRGILVEAFALRPARGVRPHALGQFLPQERIEAVAALLIGLKVQVEADDGKRAGVERSDAVEGGSELIQLRHTTMATNEHAIAGPTPTLSFSSAALRR